MDKFLAQGAKVLEIYSYLKFGGLHFSNYVDTPESSYIGHLGSFLALRFIPLVLNVHGLSDLKP